MLTNLFLKKAEELSPSETLTRLEEYLKDLGYAYDEDANNKIRSQMLREALEHGLEVFCEGQICPEQLIYTAPYQARYIAEKAIITRANPLLGGVQLTDKVQFVMENYYTEFPFSLDLGDEFPSVYVQKELTVQDILSQPHPTPVKSITAQLGRALEKFVA